jgi:shikimate dehydrogenase
MIYNPPATRLMQDAQKGGLKTANGLSMLVHQGARALEIWSNATVDTEIMQTAARKALQRPHK